MSAHTLDGRHSSPTAIALALVALAGVMVGCGAAGGAQRRPAEVTAPTGAAADSVEGGADATTASSVAAQRSTGDYDPAVLAATIAEGAAGDPEWIEVFALLRARSWLANRFPGRIDVHTIYAESLAAASAIPNQEEWAAAGVYLDEPLPRLVSVVATGEVGLLTELDVVVEVGEAIVRLEADDSIVERLPGARTRGLFLIGADGPDGTWRIHSINEINLDADRRAPTDTTLETEEPTP